MIFNNYSINNNGFLEPCMIIFRLMSKKKKRFKIIFWHKNFFSNNFSNGSIIDYIQRKWR